MSELDPTQIRDLDDLNARLWAWCETIYHHTPHAGLAGQTPLARYQQDLPRIRTLGPLAARLDALFYHRIPRKVRKDATVSYQGKRFEVPYELARQRVQLVVDPHTEQVMGVEDNNGQSLGAATPLDAVANAHRTRRKSTPAPAPQGAPTGPNAVELAYREYHALPAPTDEEQD